MRNTFSKMSRRIDVLYILLCRRRIKMSFGVEIKFHSRESYPCFVRFSIRTMKNIEMRKNNPRSLKYASW